MRRIVDAARYRRIPFKLAYEGAGKDLELAGAGKELAGAGNWGTFLPGLRRISETYDHEITKIDPKSRKTSSIRVQKETK